jgi:ATP-dependent Clp protease ATP-binding subunit ClpA
MILIPLQVHHGVEISDAALVTAAVYGARYISDRFLPDKAIGMSSVCYKDSSDKQHA